MRILVVMTVFILLSSVANAQKIKLETSFWTGEKFYLGDTEVTKEKVLSLIKSDENSAKLLGNYELKASTAYIGGLIGGAMFGYPLGTALAGKDPEMGILGSGAVIIIGSVILDNNSNKNLEEAIAEYNKTH